jgi:hypothetical protein
MRGSMRYDNRFRVLPWLAALALAIGLAGSAQAAILGSDEFSGAPGACLGEGGDVDASSSLNWLNGNVDSRSPITVSNADQPPVFTVLANVIVETTQVGTLKAADRETGASLTFSIAGGDDQDLFDITPGSPGSGIAALAFKAAPGTPGGPYHVEVAATDAGGNSSPLKIEVMVVVAGTSNAGSIILFR